MRSVAIVSVLFIILLIAIFINSAFILSSTSELTDLAHSIPSVKSEECFSALKIFESKWNKFKKAASLTVSYSELNRISCLIEELYVHHSNKNEVDFDHGIAVMINSLNELSRFEQFSFNAII